MMSGLHTTVSFFASRMSGWLFVHARSKRHTFVRSTENWNTMYTVHSIVLYGDRMCWSREDISRFQAEVTNRAYSTFSTRFQIIVKIIIIIERQLVVHVTCSESRIGEWIEQVCWQWWNLKMRKPHGVYEQPIPGLLFGFHGKLQ